MWHCSSFLFVLNAFSNLSPSKQFVHIRLVGGNINRVFNIKPNKGRMMTEEKITGINRSGVTFFNGVN